MLNNESLGNNDIQRHMHALVYNSLKANKKVQQMIRKAYGMLVFIRRGFEDRRIELL